MSVIEELKTYGFKFNENFGQNFITDKNLLKSIVLDSEISTNDVVLEIGAGAGTLTEELSNSCKQVVSYEIDNNLKDYLTNKFKDRENVKIIFSDFLKLDNSSIEQQFNSNIKVVANLPYYITTPLIFKLLYSNLKIDSLTLMVQKEVALRIIAKPKTKDYGELSVVLQSFCDVEVRRIVTRNMFTPQPKVDSAIIYIKPKNKFNIKNRELFLKTVRACFYSRRKTLINNLSSYFNISKNICENILNELGVSNMIRGEELEIQTIISLSEIIENNFKKQQK